MLSEPGSFAHFTLTKRLPAILRAIVAENRFVAELEARLQSLEQDLAHGRVRPLEDDGGPDLADWAEYVAPYLGQRWLDLPWYFAEAYFYRRILEATGYFAPGPGQGVDLFQTQKQLNLETMRDAIRALATYVDGLVMQGEGLTQAGFVALVHQALWGNRVDLSQLPVAGRTYDLSSAAAHAEQERILVDDTPRLWKKVEGLWAARVDFILDNAGFELFCDLCLADLLLAAERVETVHFHVKAHPTYVSDATAQDVAFTLGEMAADGHPAMNRMAARLESQRASGRWRLEDGLFWISPLVFWEMPAALRLDLTSDLVLVKGDANYRRLLGDRHWPFTTSIEDIVAYFPAPLAAIRALKSELVAGLAPGQAEEAARQDPEWMTAGRWGVIQFLDIR
jgi:hypothetical protein